ncbi:MAG: hypothetical protein ACLUEK_07630 [Oscillospiraceae bacterium]
MRYAFGWSGLYALRYSDMEADAAVELHAAHTGPREGTERRSSISARLRRLLPAPAGLCGFARARLAPGEPLLRIDLDPAALAVWTGEGYASRGRYVLKLGASART